MSGASSHALLSHVAELQRDKEAVALQQLTDYRGTLTKIVSNATTQLTVVQQLKDKKVEQGAMASELILLDQSLSEYQREILEVSCEIATLDVAIKQQKDKWIKAHHAMKSHETLNQELLKKGERRSNQRIQNEQDDQFLANITRNKRVSL